MADEEVLLGVATPAGGWDPCVCGSTTWPHDCVWGRLKTTLDLPEAAAARTVTLPPCEVCGFDGWPVGGMHAARDIHMRAHERKGES